jgi:putative transposase
MSQPLPCGSEAFWNSVRVRIREPAYRGIALVTVLGDPTEAIREVQVSELIAVANEVSAPIPAPPMRSIPDSDWKAALDRATVCRSLLSTGSLTLETLATAASGLGLSVRTLQRDLTKMRRTDHPAMLVPQRGGRPIGSSVIRSEVALLIEQKIDQVYLQGHQPTLHETAEEIRAQCRLTGLPQPSDKTVRLRVERMDAYAVLKRRLGAKAAKYLRKPMVGHIEATRAFECVQIDHTLADVILRSDDNYRVVLGRPWVTLAMDVRTRMVVGVYITFDPPSATSVAICMVNILTPKEPFLEWLGLEGTWPAFGRPELIYVDNGKDFHSKALQRGCEAIGADLQYRPVGSPHYGGLIERLIGTMMGRCRLLPGCTQRDVRERGDYDAEAQAVMTLSEFRAWFVNEIVTQYHPRAHRVLGHPPLTEWKAAVEEHGAPKRLPASWSLFEVFAAFLPAVERRIQRYGIQWENHYYWHPALAEWIGTVESREIFYDPRDIRFVYLRGPNGLMFRAEATQSKVPPISLGEWKSHRAQGRRLTQDPAFIAMRDAGLLVRRDMINNAREATTKSQRAQVRSRQSREQNPPMLTFESKGIAAEASAAPHVPVKTTPLPIVYDAEIWSL